MPQNVLFVCVENAGRSQMAEAFFRKFASKRYGVISAGTAPSPRLDPTVIQVMREVGIDMSGQTPKLLSDSMITNSYKTVNMGCMDEESCPLLFVKDNDIADWNIPDPKERSIQEVRVIRDSIKSKVIDLVNLFDVDADK